MELKLTAGGKETGASARGIRQPFVVYRLSFTIGPFFVTYKKRPTSSDKLFLEGIGTFSRNSKQ